MLRSISDDDLCADCIFSEKKQGTQAGCSKGWPGILNDDDRVTECLSHRDPSRVIPDSDGEEAFNRLQARLERGWGV